MKQECQQPLRGEFSTARCDFNTAYRKIVDTMLQDGVSVTECERRLKEQTSERECLLKCERAREQFLIAHANRANVSIYTPALDHALYPDGIGLPPRVMMDNDLLPPLL